MLLLTRQHDGKGYTNINNTQHGHCKVGNKDDTNKCNIKEVTQEQACRKMTQIKLHNNKYLQMKDNTKINNKN